MSANAVTDMTVSRQIGPFVIDFYPEGDEVALFIWRSPARNSGYCVVCPTPDHVRAVVRQVEAIA